MNAKTIEIDGKVRETYEHAKTNFQKSLVIITGSEVKAGIILAVMVMDNPVVDEISELTGFYPSTVRESIQELSEKGLLAREKLKTAEGQLGKKPYIYRIGNLAETMDDYVEKTKQKFNTIKEVVNDFEKVKRESRIEKE